MMFILLLKATFELFGGHILLAYPSSPPSTTCIVHLHSITSLSHLWRPSSEFDFRNPSSLKGVASVVLQVAGNNVPAQVDPCAFWIQVTECPVHAETYDLAVVVQNSVRTPTSRLASAWRRIRPRHRTDANDQSRIWKKTVSRYHMVLSANPNAGPDSSQVLPQPALVSIRRHSANCAFTPGSRYAVCWDGRERCRGQPGCHSGQLEVQRLHEAGTNGPLVLSVPDLDTAKDVQVSDTGAIMVRSESDVRIFYFS
ncbi:hypothetical protein C8J57DRAFT_1527347 [Mycena rebaudengoi]|nr:hypothetical protein C8J57DRAFT_1527347 [Mycena rebaudengoi]